MIRFRLRTDKLLYDTYNSEMWCAGYIMNGGCSDDGFEYFRNWIISRGKETYYKAKTNPDYLINEVVEGEDFYEFESFWYVALEAFKNKTGKNLYDYIDDDNFKAKEGNYVQFEFTWKEEEPESMKKICPKLFAKFNELNFVPCSFSLNFQILFNFSSTNYEKNTLHFSNSINFFVITFCTENPGSCGGERLRSR